MMSMNADGWPPPVWQGGTVCKYCGVEYSPPGSHVLCSGRGSYNRGVAAERERVLRVLETTSMVVAEIVHDAKRDGIVKWTDHTGRILATLRAHITEDTDAD